MEGDKTMSTIRQTLERNFFRGLNTVVEPAVRKGVLSPRCAPVGLIVLESTGFKSGVLRSTPLLATHIGDYVLVSTGRAKRSFWVRNLQKQPNIRFHLGGKVKKATSYVITPDEDFQVPKSLPPIVAAAARQLAKRSGEGWAFALLEAKN
jgi:deazaflavin-dependent oxidoreductase (nitroreductase family)